MPTITKPNDTDNLIFQALATSWLLLDLEKHEFLKSTHFENMEFSIPSMKKVLSECKITNRGCALMILYALLVLPKERISSSHQNEYTKLNESLNKWTQNTVTTYRSDLSYVNFIRHIRNAVAHANIEFKSFDVIIFTDEYRNQTFSTELPLPHLRDFISELQSVHIAYAISRETEESEQDGPPDS